MNIDQKEIFISKIKDYFKSKRDIELTEKKCEWYWQTLCDYELSDIANALRYHDRDPKRGGYPPKPADIISKIEKIPVVGKRNCEFTKKNEKLIFCKNEGIISWGNPGADGFWQCEESKKAWSDFENNYWTGKRTVCEGHYEEIRQIV